MKRALLICIIACWPLAAAAQSFVNPPVLAQSGDIILQNTDVYYAPFAPPGDSDTRENLCTQSDQIRDVNGVGDQWRRYFPVIYDNAVDSFVMLKDWPHGAPVGQNVAWQRLFHARDKPGGGHSDIVVGSYVTPSGWLFGPGYGPVVVSKNEDVDFRASGTIKLESGFHVMPGAFFHAYIEPKWDTTVFSDEFNDTAIFRSQWSIMNGYGNNFNPPECSADTNVRLWADTGVNGAHDGWALDMMMREDTDTCRCAVNIVPFRDDTCESVPSPTDTSLATHHKSYFTSAVGMACPFPFKWRGRDSNDYSLGPSAYAHAPYGKYEFRGKTPHLPHHSNDWGGGSFEWDLNETNACIMGIIDPNFHVPFREGPARGHFQRITADSALFISHDTGFWWRRNAATSIIVNNVAYTIMVWKYFAKDTAVAYPGYFEVGRQKFPASLINSTEEHTFYYTVWPHTNASKVRWTVDTASDHKWRIFSAPYDTTWGTSKLFSRDFQPVNVTLLTFTGLGDTVLKSYRCHWVDSLNHPNHGILYLDDTMDTGVIHYNTEAYGYEVGGIGYGTAPIVMDTTDLESPPELSGFWTGTRYDTLRFLDSTHAFYARIAAYDSSSYRYHTYTMEFLPNEIDILIDSNVVRRWPDRLIPRNSRYYDQIAQLGRYPSTIQLPELDLDGDGLSSMNSEKLYFESHTHNPGFKDVNGRPAAHHLVDYIKVWDVPKSVQIPDYPN